MEEEKKRKRKAYLDSFQKDNNGKYVYKGDMYVFQPQERELRREMARLWGLALVMISAQIIAGCVDAPGTGRSFYVLIPYMISLIAGISVCWGLGRMTEGGAVCVLMCMKRRFRRFPEDQSLPRSVQEWQFWEN